MLLVDCLNLRENFSQTFLEHFLLVWVWNNMRVSQCWRFFFFLTILLFIQGPEQYLSDGVWQYLSILCKDLWTKPAITVSLPISLCQSSITVVGNQTETKNTYSWKSEPVFIYEWCMPLYSKIKYVLLFQSQPQVSHYPYKLYRTTVFKTMQKYQV